jgi:hypothetical protein
MSKTRKNKKYLKKKKRVRFSTKNEISYFSGGENTIVNTNTGFKETLFSRIPQNRFEIDDNLCKNIVNNSLKDNVPSQIPNLINSIKSTNLRNNKSVKIRR